MFGMSFVPNKKRCAFRRTPPRPDAASTLIEVLVAMMLSVLALTAFYASSGQAIRIVKSGKETALASQLLQERIGGSAFGSRLDQRHHALGRERRHQ